MRRSDELRPAWACSSGACPSRGLPQPGSAITPRPNHPLPRQDLHLRACPRLKAAPKNLLFRRAARPRRARSLECARATRGHRRHRLGVLHQGGSGERQAGLLPAHHAAAESNRGDDAVGGWPARRSVLPRSPDRGPPRGTGRIPARFPFRVVRVFRGYFHFHCRGHNGKFEPRTTPTTRNSGRRSQ